MKLFKTNSIRTKLYTFTATLVFLTILAITWPLLTILINQIKEERIHRVGQVADNRHQLLRLQLLSFNNSNKDLLQRIDAFCASKGYSKTCVTERLQLQVNLVNANGALFRQKNNNIVWSVGKIENSGLSEKDFPAGQLAVFNKRGINNRAQPFTVLSSDKKIGIEVLMEFPLDIIQKIFQPLNDLGKSGETFLADKEGFFITEMRYHAHQGISEIISADPMITCLQKNNTEVLDADYRNEAIIHGFRYIPEIGGGCIMAHIEQKEAFSILKSIVQKIIILAVALLLLLLLLIYIFAKKITTPLIYLAKLAESIGLGNYHLKSKIKQDDEIGKLSDAFNQMIDKMIGAMEDQRAKIQAENADKQKSAFLASISHEIRTPLHSMIGITEILMNSSLNKEQSDLVKVAHNAGESLLSVINDTLDLSRIESGAMNLENIPFLLSEQIESCIAIIGVRAKEKNITLNWTIEDNIYDQRQGDPTRLRQIILNLLSNAVKFSEKGIVSLKVKTITDTKLLFSVSDQGIGIPADKQNIIFKSFKQVDASVTRNFGGSGLGLAISKKLVEMMKGQIWVESQLGNGSTFFFSVDLPNSDNRNNVAKESALNKEEATQKLVKPLKILIADDNEVNLLLFELFLKNIHHMVSAKNGQEAFDLFIAESFDLVFLDVGMPIMDGYTATRKIRHWEKENHKKPTIIIACTANAFATDIKRSLEAGCDDHLAKPFSKDNLIEIISKHTE